MNGELWAEAAARNFSKLTIYSRNPGALADFYENLGLPREPLQDGSELLLVGGSRLRLAPADRLLPAYHIAFQGAPNGVEAIRDWLGPRVQLLTQGAGEGGLFRFEFISAAAVYFCDVDGNVMEVLCPQDEEAPAASEVTLREATGVCEVGVPVPDPPELVGNLERAGSLRLWRGDRQSFAMVGGAGGSLIVVPSTQGRRWLSSEALCLTAPLEATMPLPAGSLHIQVSEQGVRLSTDHS